MVSENFGDDTKQWVSETSPSFSEMWARTEFPVLVELSSRQITYYRKTPFRKYGLYQNLQKLSDKWFGFQVKNNVSEVDHGVLNRLVKDLRMEGCNSYGFGETCSVLEYLSELEDSLRFDH